MNGLPLLSCIDFFAFLIYTSLIIVILSLNIKQTLNRVSAGIFACFALWSIGKIFIHNPDTPESLAILFDKIDGISWCTYPALALWFTFIITGIQKPLKSKAFYILALLLPVLFTYTQWSNLLMTPPVKRYYGWHTDWNEKSIWPYVYYVYFAGIIVFNLVYTAIAALKSYSKNTKQQLIIIFISTFIPMLLGCYFEIITLRLKLPGWDTPATDSVNIYVLIWALGTYYAIFKHQLYAISPAMAADNIIATMADSVIILNNENKIVFANDSTLKLLGFERRELIDKSFDFLFTDNNIKRILIEKILTEHTAINNDVFLKTKNGQAVPVSFSATAILEEGSLKGIVCISTDMTEHKQMEEKILESEKILSRNNRALKVLNKSNQLLLHADNEVLFLQDVCRNIVETGGYKLSWIGFAENDGKKTVRPVAQYGYEEGYLETVNITWADEERGRGPTGTCIRTGLPSVSNDILNDPDFMPWRENALKRGYASSVGLPLFLENGNVIGAIMVYAKEPDAFIEEELVLLTELAGNAAYGIIMLRIRKAYDAAVSELRKSEERLRRFYESGMIGVTYWNMDGKITDANDKFLEMTGYTRADLEAGLIDWIHMTPEEYSKADEASVKELMETGVNKAPFEKEYIRKDKTRVPVIIAGAMLDLERFNGVAFALDITKQKEFDKKLNTILKDLERSNTELEQFAYIASHDLQEPLRSISGFVQLLKQKYSDKLDETARRYIDISVAGTERMRDLITDLLEFSRVETKREPFKNVDINVVLDSVIFGMKSRIEDAGAIIIKDTLPVVKGDEIQMAQVFQNLISNALKFRSAVKPEIHVGAKELGKETLFWVKDNGIGIEQQYFKKIFVIFQRLHTREEYSGTGIGLAICRKIVERHGGKIWVESETGKGSTFYFTINT